MNFLALATYSRVLLPSQYGHYALVIAAVGLAHLMLFQWLCLGLFRFLPTYEAKPEAFLSTIAALFLGLLGLSGLLGGIGIIWLVEPAWRGMAVLALLLLWVEAWFQLNLELAHSQLSPQRYGAMALTRAVLAVICGATLTWYFKLGPWGPLFGLAVGMLGALWWQGTGPWKRVRPALVEWAILRQLVGYSLPLAANFALGFVVHSSDRLLLGWLQGAESTGLYAVGYDLAQQSLGVLLMSINLAAYPLVVRALEQHGVAAAQEQLRQNGTVLLAIALPALVGLSILAPNLAGVILGSAFQESAAILIPWIALAACMAGLKHYYTDLAFQLSKRTNGQVWVMLIAAIVNLMLNLWWIPWWGARGAAYATVMAYGVGIAFSWIWGRRIWPLPFPKKAIVQIVIVAFGLAVALWPLRQFEGGYALAGQVVWSGLVYGGLLLALNVGKSREIVRRYIRPIRGFKYEY